MTLVRATVGRFGFGADYNPEQWPEAVWDADVQLMKQAGVSIVTLGVFSWANVEPEPGRFDFGWFDRVMDRMADAGIAVCLATMTASPPPWLARAHPETLPRRADGTVLWPGSRQHFCPSSPVYRDHAARLTRQVVTRYGEHPALAMWHIGNEYGCHVPMCYCDTSAEAFREWLADRYGSVDALNEAWSTAFWSQRYSDFAEVWPPRTVPTFGNPGQQLDFRRFSSDALLECFHVEKRIIRQITPRVPVTTNFVGAWHRIDNAEWAKHQDVISYDSYPDPHDPDSHVEAAFTYDLMRSLGGGKPWLLMEQAPNAVNWRIRNGAKAPGVMRLWSLQAVARGADAVMYFQWRQSRGGAERFHSGMVPHGGPDTRVFREVRDLGAELAGLGDVLGSTVEADVAVLMDWSNGWALENTAHPVADLTLQEANLSHYRPLWEEGISVDVVPVTADLARYKLVVVPNLYLVEPATAERITRYVRAGGHVVVSFFSGIVDGNDRVHLGGYPAPFRELLGLAVAEFWPLAEGERVGLSNGTGGIWSEWITPEGAETVATFTGGDLAGRPAVTRHTYGAGVAHYLGTRPDPATLRAILGQAAEAAGVRPVVPGAPAGVEATVRRTPEGERWLFLLNHNNTEVTVPTPAGPVTLPGRDVRITRIPT